jgi:lipoprotein-anchoring transpeptidase ErfK/SrfK
VGLVRAGKPTQVRRAAAVAGIVMMTVLAAACTSGTHGTGGAGSTNGAAPGANSGHGGGASPTPSNDPAVTISPANGARAADPSAGVTVTATRGTIKSVTVTPTGTLAADNGNPSGQVPGSLAADGTSWHTTWALGVSQQYMVTVVASHAGVTKTTTSAFTTLTPAATFSTNIFEGSGQTYGVGIPIILTFSQPVTDKAAVEQSMEIKTSKPVVGAWYWDTDKSLVFRPRSYWPAYTTVSFTGHLDGVKAGPGLYGYHTLTQSFTIGQSVIAVASTKAHRTQIYVGGKLKYNWPISSGRPGDDTPNGSYLTIEKENPVLMKGPGYALEVPFSVRFTWSGDYYHDAYWSVGEQGFANVSHGCVNLSPSDAQTYYNLAVPGDPITITNSPKAGTMDNGWTYWFLTWNQLVAGSATHQAVQAGPSGSTFVNPSTLAPIHVTAPLEAAATGIWGTGPAQ